jgi:hypothetical protein
MSNRHEPRIVVAPQIASRREKMRLAIRALIITVTVAAVLPRWRRTARRWMPRWQWMGP